MLHCHTLAITLLITSARKLCSHPCLYVRQLSACVFAYISTTYLYQLKRRSFCMLRNTRSKLMRIIYHLTLEVIMTKFKILVFRYVSQSANKLKKYV